MLDATIVVVVLTTKEGQTRFLGRDGATDLKRSETFAGYAEAQMAIYRRKATFDHGTTCRIEEKSKLMAIAAASKRQPVKRKYIEDQPITTWMVDEGGFHEMEN